MRGFFIDPPFEDQEQLKDVGSIIKTFGRLYLFFLEIQIFFFSRKKMDINPIIPF